MEEFILRAVTYKVLHVLILPMNIIYILITLLYGVTAHSIFFPVLFTENTSQSPKKGSIMDTHYYDLIQQQFIPFLQEGVCLETTVFLQVGEASHIAQAVTALLPLWR